MDQIVIDIINRFGYIGIMLLVAVENIFPPIPSEVILTFGGFMTTVSDMAVWGVILSATLGSVVGALVLYCLGRLLNAERLERFLDSKLGKKLRLKKADVYRAEGWFRRHGNGTIFFCRFIPLVRSLISVPAGAAKMSMGVFLLLTTLGTLIWNTLLVYLGKFAGHAWDRVVGYLSVYSWIALAILGLICIAVAILFIKKRFLKTSDRVKEEDAKE